MTGLPPAGPVRVAFRCPHQGCRPRYCPAGRPVLEWTYARPALASSRLEDAPRPTDDGPVIIPPPIEPARPCTLEDVPAAWRKILRPEECTVAIGWAKSTGRTVRKVRSVIGRGELWRVLLESPPGVPGQGYAFAGGWVAEGPDRKVRAVGAREVRAAIVASRRRPGAPGAG